LVTNYFFGCSAFAKIDTTNRLNSPTNQGEGNAILTLIQPPSAVQCDVILHLDPPAFGSKIFLFARYWIAKDYYHLGVVWSEPHGSGLWFPIYPPSLSLGSDNRFFSISHSIYSTNSAVFDKPVGERGVFRHLFGAYPIQDIRFADSEASRLIIHKNDIRNTTNHFGLKLSQVIGPQGFLDSIHLSDSNEGIRKSIKYYYESSNSANLLRRLDVTLEQEPIRVGFTEGGIQVRIHDKTFQFSDLELMKHAGGRFGKVLYKPTILGKSIAQLPYYTEIKQAPDGPILRSATFTNYLSTSLDSNQAKQAAKQYATFTPDLVKYRDFITKYWFKQPQEVSQSDRIAIQDLRDSIQAEREADAGSIGRLLRRANVIIELNRILGENSLTAEAFRSYLKTLQQNQMFDILLTGGASVIEVSMIWNRLDEADILLEEWLKSVNISTNILELNRYISREINTGRAYIALRLLQKIEANPSVPFDHRFQLAVMQFLAWAKVETILSTPVDNHNLPNMAQSKWISRSISIGAAEKERRTWMQTAKKRFSQVNKPNHDQLTWKEILDRVEFQQNEELVSRVLTNIIDSAKTNAP
jgi:hypothetical protein